ncbi:hypothetical protein MLD38_029843 [Melastoma candidum]|uniref:Uncharacterized protein n=1 Tax=Melastoma candidum TaxID=119954 RepID=A0ACB9N6J1_9MYRT|nr:hypothetical protein MLD38_029843 [Melastoma candidum]
MGLLFEFRPKSVILVLLVLSIVSSSEHVTLAQSRPLSTSASSSSSTVPSHHTEQGISKVLATLGVVCKCCDSAGDCTSLSNSGSCHKVQCLPWKLS